MFVVNAGLALTVALIVWYFASRWLAQLIMATETRNPRMVERPVWNAISMGATFVVFLVAVAVWAGLAYALEMLSH